MTKRKNKITRSGSEQTYNKYLYCVCPLMGQELVEIKLFTGT